jgi:hypothetical protein
LDVNCVTKAEGEMATDEEVRAAVLAAFNRARTAGRPPVDCYRAGVEVWRQHYPDQAAEYAAKQAVAVILNATASDLLAVE